MSKAIAGIWTNAWVELILRWAIGITFIYVSFHKIMNPARFAEVIYGYQLFPGGSINLIAILLPSLELFSGTALILGIYPRSAMLVVGAMLLAFIVALSVNLVRGLKFDCGCFAFGEATPRTSVVLLLVRDVIYFLAGLPVLFYPGARKGCLLQTGSLLKNS